MKFSILFLSLLTALAFSTHAAPKRVLLIGQGPDGHPVGTHEYMAGVKVIEQLFKPFAADITTTIVKADEPWPEGPALIDKADGIVLLVTQGAQWMQATPERYAALQKFCERKGALVALHWSVGAKDATFIAGQLALLGGTRGGPQRKYVVQENDIHIAAPQHPVVAGLGDFRINDEFYYRLDLQPKSDAFIPLLTTQLEGREETIGWAWDRPDGGRSFGFVCLHFHKNWERIEYRRLVTQAILWTLRLPIPDGGLKDAQLPLPEGL